MKKYEVEQVHAELDSMRACYLGAIINSLQSTDLSSDEIKKCVEVRKKLESLGAVNTPAYVKAERVCLDEETRLNNLKEFSEKYTLWKSFKHCFPNSSFITYKQLIYLVNKYHLCIDVLQFYAKDIPTKTVEILEAASNTLLATNCNVLTNQDLYRINKLKLYSDMSSDLINKIQTSFTLCPFIFNRYGGSSYTSFISGLTHTLSTSVVTKEIMKRFNLNENNIHIDSCDVSGISKLEFFIAAPQSDFVPNRLSFKVINKPLVQDPIVFQFTSLGILVHDKWGEVLEDDLFK